MICICRRGVMCRMAGIAVTIRLFICLACARGKEGGTLPNRSEEEERKRKEVCKVG